MESQGKQIKKLENLLELQNKNFKLNNQRYGSLNQIKIKILVFLCVRAHFHVEKLPPGTLAVHEADLVQPSKHVYLRLKNRT